MLYPPTDTFLDKPTQELELDFCSVSIYQHLSFAHVIWGDGLSVKAYRTNVLQVLHLVTQLKIKYLLSDAHHLKLLDNNDWFTRVCGPILVKSGLQKIARIVPYNQTAITQSQKLVEAQKRQSQNHQLAFDFENFTDYDNAFHWLNINHPALLRGY